MGVSLSFHATLKTKCLYDIQSAVSENGLILLNISIILKLFHKQESGWPRDQKINSDSAKFHFLARRNSYISLQKQVYIKYLKMTAWV